MEHKFQIHLRGLIDLLSNHLYSTPEVFLRELLQNGVDAIRARGYAESGHRGEIAIEVHHRSGKAPTLSFADNGKGLTEEEVHRFLATIGETSKRAADWDRPVDFLGQFGIGLLSCFVVSDEIVVVTRSIQGGRPLEWRGRPDGTYSLKPLTAELAPGTQVYLTCKKGCEEQFDADRVRERVKHYGGLLPFPIRVIEGKRSDTVNEGGAPWRQEHRNAKERTKTLLEFGRDTFGMKFFDAIPLKSKVGAVDGVAFVLPFTPNLATKQKHRVYLKNMLLSEQSQNLLPDWAFFVKAIVNADDLRPTASRESFYEDEKLDATRVVLGECLKQYLIELSKSDERKLEQFIQLHYLSIKALAIQDDEFFKLFIHWLTFETTLGDMTLGEYRERHDTLRCVPDLDQFRQITRVAAAQNLCVLNASYTYDMELLSKYGAMFDEVSVEIVEAQSLAQSFADLAPDQQSRYDGMMTAADAALKPFGCAAEVKDYEPKELPALYVTSGEGRFQRSLEQSKEIANPLWSGVLDNLNRRERRVGPMATLTFNAQNSLVQRLSGLRDRVVLQRAIQMLYIQALLLGHHPLTAKELALLNEGLLALIDWSARAES